MGRGYQDMARVSKIIVMVWVGVRCCEGELGDRIVIEYAKLEVG